MLSRFILLCLLSAYSLVGIVFLGWNIFYLVYLYWFENVINIFVHIFKVYSTPYLSLQSNTATRSQALGALFGSLFANFVYFVFIIVGIGVLFPLLIVKGEEGRVFLFASLKIILFIDRDFNRAILACTLYKVGEYLYFFWIRPQYTAQKPYEVPPTFNKHDLVLHITILLGMGLGFMMMHPDFGGKIGLNNNNWAKYSVGIVMVLARLGFDVWELNQKPT